jgi:hydrogenase/urease accessory protein HupE
MLVLLLALVGAPALQAHEVRPAHLQIQQTGTLSYDVIWKQPTQGEVPLRLVPHLSTGWLEQPAVAEYSAPGFLIRNWRVRAAPGESLSGATIEIEGLAGSITDALISVRWLNGKRVELILRPDQPRQVIAGQAAALSVPAYLLLGIKHILSGPDHLLFVLGLMLLVKGRWMLLRTVTAFTLAHSITLALMVTGLLQLPTAFTEATIALSILLLACEIVRQLRGGYSLAIARPWVLAFIFGLFHGMGFGGALLQVGFPADALPVTLALFNVGVELGQLAFIAVALLATHAIATMGWNRSPVATALPTYVIGICGAYWTIERGVQWLTR